MAEPQSSGKKARLSVNLYLYLPCKKTTKRRIKKTGEKIYQNMNCICICGLELVIFFLCYFTLSNFSLMDHLSTANQQRSWGGSRPCAEAPALLTGWGQHHHLGSGLAGGPGAERRRRAARQPAGTGMGGSKGRPALGDWRNCARGWGVKGFLP